MKINAFCSIDCFVTGYSFEGGDLGSATTARDRMNCHIACIKNSDCYFSTYDTNSKNCQLKSSIVNVISKGNVQSGPKVCLTKEKAKEAMKSISCAFAGYYPSGVTTIVNNAGSIEICYKICQKASKNDCQVWTYNASDRTCTLYHWEEKKFIIKKMESLCRAMGLGWGRPIRCPIKYDLKTSPMILYKRQLVTYNPDTNPRISGPKNC